MRGTGMVSGWGDELESRVQGSGKFPFQTSVFLGHLLQFPLKLFYFFYMSIFYLVFACFLPIFDSFPLFSIHFYLVSTRFYICYNILSGLQGTFPCISTKRNTY